jgi:hypothetical protein
MSQISTVAAALNVPPADVAALIPQLSDVDYADTVHHNADINRDPLDVIHLPNGYVVANVHLTPEAIAGLFEQFHGDLDVLADKFGIYR